MRTASSAWGELVLIAQHGNIGSRSDLEVGVKVFVVKQFISFL
jgi:hypothetical protein